MLSLYTSSRSHLQVLYLNLLYLLLCFHSGEISVCPFGDNPIAVSSLLPCSLYFVSFIPSVLSIKFIVSSSGFVEPLIYAKKDSSLINDRLKFNISWSSHSSRTSLKKLSVSFFSLYLK